MRPLRALARRLYDAGASVGARFDLDTVRTRHYDAVVMYHSVKEPPAVREHTSDITVREFRRHLQHYTDEFEVVALPELLAPAPDRKRVALTFDDGYRDFHTNVRPVLHEFDVPATAFLVSSFLDDANPREQVMNTGHLYDVLTTDQVAELVADPLVTVGNHTRTHHDLGAHHREDIIDTEVRGAKADLETRFDCEVTCFSYPNGRYNETSMAVVRDSHALGVMDESRRPVIGDEDAVVLPRVDGGLPFEQVRFRCSDLNGELMRYGRRLVA